MKFLSTKAHAVIDYIMGVLLIAAPWLFDFANGGAAQWVSVILGLGMLIYRIVTNYELGMLKILPMNIHLAIDYAAGIILAIIAFGMMADPKKVDFFRLPL